jgi:anti-sigma B factor antagonist
VPLPVFDPTAELLTLTLIRDDEGAHLCAAGEVDACTAPRFAAALDGALADGPLQVAVDLHAVTFLTCAGVHALAAGYRRAAAAGTRFHVSASRPAVLRPLELSGLWPAVGADQPHHAA